MDYAAYITAVVNLLDMSAILVDATSATPTSNTPFNQSVPRSIEYVELRMQRDLDLVNTYVRDESGILTPNVGTFTLPTVTGIFVVVTEAYPIIGGIKQVPMLPTSIEFLDWAYPAAAAPSVPSVPGYWANFDGVSIRLGPSPDQGYGIGIVGTQRLSQMSATNTSNFLSNYLPDAYLAAGMKWWFENYQRDGAQGADPDAPKAWDMTYGRLMGPAMVEEMRKKFQSVGWSGRLPSPVATPAQT